MPAHTLPRQLLDQVLRQLDAETRLLERVQSLSEALTAGGLQGPALLEKQPELAALAQAAALVEESRQEIRRGIALAWQCPAGEVRLSRLQLSTPAETQTFDTRRQALLAQAIRTTAALRTTQGTLRGWHAIVSFVLGEVLGTAQTPDRYAADGQRVAPSAAAGIDIRS